MMQISLYTLQNVKDLVVSSQRKQVESLHLSYHKLWSLSLLCCWQSQLQQIVLNCPSVACYVNDIVQSSASSQSLHHLFVETCSWGVKNCHYLIPSVFIAYSFDQVFSSSQFHLVILRILLCILNSLCTDLDSQHFNIGQLILNRDSYCSNSTSQIQNHITHLYCLNYVFV